MWTGLWIISEVVIFGKQCLTYLTSMGLTDSQLQIISGHTNKDTLAIYQRTSPISVDSEIRIELEL